MTIPNVDDADQLVERLRQFTANAIEAWPITLPKVVASLIRITSRLSESTNPTEKVRVKASLPGVGVAHRKIKIGHKSALKRTRSRARVCGTITR